MRQIQLVLWSLAPLPEICLLSPKNDAIMFLVLQKLTVHATKVFCPPFLKAVRVEPLLTL